MFSNFSKHHQDERGEGGREGIPASSNVTLEGHRARVSLACLNWKYQKRFDSAGKAVRNLNEGTVLGLKQSWEGPHLPFPVQNVVYLIYLLLFHVSEHNMLIWIRLVLAWQNFMFEVIKNQSALWANSWIDIWFFRLCLMLSGLGNFVVDCHV